MLVLATEIPTDDDVTLVDSKENTEVAVLTRPAEWMTVTCVAPFLNAMYLLAFTRVETRLMVVVVTGPPKSKEVLAELIMLELVRVMLEPVSVDVDPVVK